MEHEDDLNIRKKLLAWETQPYPLDTDRLWNQSMVGPRVERKRREFIYYAAASLVLAAAIVYYSRQESERAITQLRLREVELSLVEARNRSQSADQAITMVPCPEPVQTSQQKRRPAQQVAKVAMDSSPTQVPVPSEPVVPEPVVTVADNTESTDSIATNSFEETPGKQALPRVILGGLSIREKAPSHPSRLHLSLFRNEDLGEGKQSPPQVVSLAGINH